jgi:hypothetical protein
MLCSKPLEIHEIYSEYGTSNARSGICLEPQPPRQSNIVVECSSTLQHNGNFRQFCRIFPALSVLTACGRNSLLCITSAITDQCLS